jgi:hypothetical protein
MVGVLKFIQSMLSSAIARWFYIALLKRWRLRRTTKDQEAEAQQAISVPFFTLMSHRIDICRDILIL